MENRITDNLRLSYDNQAVQRNESRLDEWKRIERDKFLTLLQCEKKRTLLEIGSGPGRDGLFLPKTVSK